MNAQQFADATWIVIFAAMMLMMFSSDWRMIKVATLLACLWMAALVILSAVR